MANLQYMLGANPEEADIARKRQMAQILSQQAVAPSEGQMVSGHYVAPGAGQALAKVLSGYMAGKTGREADELQKAAGEQRQAAFRDTAQKYAQALRGTPEQRSQFQADNPFGEDLGNLQTVTPAQPGSREAAMDVAMQSQSPEWQQMGLQQLMAAPQQAEQFTLGEGQVRYGPGGQVIARGPEKAAKEAQFSQDMSDYLRSYGIDPATASREQLTKAYQDVQEIKNRRASLSGQTVTLGTPQIFTTPEGQTVFVQPANRPGAAPQVTPLPSNLRRAAEEKPPTEAENTAAGYLGRMRAAEKLIGGIKGGESTEKTNIASSIPFVGGYAERKAMTPEQQQYKQAADDWIRSKLRKESGAVIGADEMAAEYRTYFPQPGDSKQVIQQKAQARKQAEKQFEISAGRAMSKLEQPKPAMSYDAEKERRYQEWKARQGK